ncbi:MAG: hypothetical protein IT178_08160 [Acidobacteria bacterium]|nr:hypothetical protein [Acidobacteriota bacterium]
MTALADLIVWASVVLAAVYVAVWAWSPRWRQTIERPKYEFQDALGTFEENRDERS